MREPGGVNQEGLLGVMVSKDRSTEQEERNTSSWRRKMASHMYGILLSSKRNELSLMHKMAWLDRRGVRLSDQEKPVSEVTSCVSPLL